MVEEDSGRPVLRFDDAESCRAFFREGLEQGAVLASLAEAPPLLQPLPVGIEVDGAASFELELRPVQAFPGSEGLQVAFELDRAALDRVEKTLKVPARQDESETRGSSPLLRIQGMNPNERARLALRCGRTERRILRRDRSPQVLSNLLNNPRSEAEDVLAVVRSPQVNTGILERVAADRRWTTNQEIRTAIVRSPKTSPPTAIRLLDSLHTEELRKLAKIGSCRENVRRAALKVYLKRQGRSR